MLPAYPAILSLTPSSQSSVACITAISGISHWLSLLVLEWVGLGWGWVGVSSLAPRLLALAWGSPMLVRIGVSIFGATFDAVSWRNS